ncbi:unnamed protein product [Arctia plantaginis]|uniref:Uncharacterized protein n=1 Tax=Arctia plantaginis TaxID=874455 RepID=A0A8S1BDW8_ARCPL|nr:unnamed protein product [Arctia plantaginis]CAB3260173.1 unnamed protein product [Arctia plantaginis]
MTHRCVYKRTSAPLRITSQDNHTPRTSAPDCTRSISSSPIIIVDMCFKVLVALACLVAALSLVPSASAIPSGLLSELVDQSICESVVDYDEDPDRIPRIIKQVKCAPKPDKMCPVHDGKGGQASCCEQNSYLNFRFSCKEVIDTVLVSDAKGDTSPMLVSVGCACAMAKSTAAIEIDNR